MLAFSTCPRVAVASPPAPTDGSLSAAAVGGNGPGLDLKFVWIYTYVVYILPMSGSRICKCPSGETVWPCACLRQL
jgi:hypothetical protein